MTLENILLLKDLLRKDEKLIKSIDIYFSKTAILGMPVFTRVVPFNGFNITSGISFAFKSSLEEYIIKR